MNTRKHIRKVTLTAVSSALRSSSSIFPPGSDVSPAYVRNEAERLKLVDYLQLNDTTRNSLA